MKIYNASVGGAFRLFISDNQTDVLVVDFDTSLTDMEKCFINDFAYKIGFRNNLKKEKNDDESDYYEWYNITDKFLDYVKQQKNPIKDINGNELDLKDLKEIKVAADTIKDKINFYEMIDKINSDYLLPERYFGKISNINCEYPFVIKSAYGKGGKGNIVCFSENDLAEVKRIFSSDLFKTKQENINNDYANKVIIEKFFSNVPSYNLSFYCNKDGSMQRENISQQIIDEVFYRGNLYPVPISSICRQKIMNIGKYICTYIGKNYNYVGWIGLDFILVNDCIYVIEANARVNSVTHAHQLAKGNSFVIKLLKHQNKDVKSVLGSFFFDNKLKCGILPYQIPNNEEILIISVNSSLSQAQKQLEEFKKQNKLTDVLQEITDGHSKSISYYVARIK